MSSSETVAPTEESVLRDSPLSRALGNSVREATTSLSGFAKLLGSLTVLVAAYWTLHQTLNLPDQWPAIIVAASIVLFVAIWVLPNWRDELKRKDLTLNGIRGVIRDPKYFRLSPYELKDRAAFKRPDAAQSDALSWIEGSPRPLLYLWGQSGVGKSSLLEAALAPALAEAGRVVVSLRLHDNPLAELSAALRRRDAIWQKGLTEEMPLRALVERAAERVAGDGKRLLLIVDQFEEALILADAPLKAELATFLIELVRQPIPRLQMLLALRAEYVNDLHELGLPTAVQGDTALEVRPFTRASAQAFLENSELRPGRQLLDEVLEEAAQIEDMPDRVRPIVLNLFGLVMASFSGALPKGIEAGQLLSGYVERAIRRKPSPRYAIHILRELVTDAGTKRTRPLADAAQRARLPITVARGCLVLLANDGLVRPLGLDTPEERWEVSHDFVARLLQPLVRGWRRSAWDAVRPWLLPSLLGAWAIVIGGLIVFYPSLHDELILAQLRSVGLVPGITTNKGTSFITNGTDIHDDALFWGTARALSDLSFPVNGLSINTDITSLMGMPSLPVLASLDLSKSKITSLEGMPSLPALTLLNLNDSGLTSFAGMPSLPLLAALDLNSTLITSFAGMPSLPKLASLDLSFSRITSLEGMPSLPVLVSLTLVYNRITSLEGMPSLPKLVELELGGNGITSLAGMPSLPVLDSLNLHGSKITSLAGMPSLPSLASLDLSNSQITSLEGLPSLPTLKKIYVDKNQLSTFSVSTSLRALLVELD